MLGSSIIYGERLPFEEQDHTEADDDEASESESESESITELRMRANSVNDIINHLNKLAFKIRNPALRPIAKASFYRELHSIEPIEGLVPQVRPLTLDMITWIEEWIERLQPSEEDIDAELSDTSSGSVPLDEAFLELDQPAWTEFGMDLFDGYSRFDRAHLRDMFRPHLSETEPGHHKDQCPVLLERLARAVTTRRRQIRYWAQHAEKLAAGPSAASLGQQIQERVMAEVQQIARPNSVEVPPQVTKIGLAPSTIYPETGLSNPYSRELEATDSQSVVSYASTTWDVEDHTIDVPPPPRETTSGMSFVSDLIVICALNQSY